MRSHTHALSELRRLARYTCFLSFFLIAMSARSLQAQDTADVIRGRVVDDSSHVLRGAAITITRGPDRLVQQTTTDSAGNYRVRFDKGTGDYLVYVADSGFASARRRVQRQTDEHELVANFTLPPAAIATLDAVKVEGRKPVRASNPIG